MNSTVPQLEIALDRTRIVRRILAIGVSVELLLAFLDTYLVFSYPDRIGPFREIFWLTREDTIGTWVSSTQTLLVGLVLLGIAVAARRLVDRGAPWVWALLAWTFVYLAADDAVQIHESIGTVVEHIGEDATGLLALLQRFPTYHWQLVFGLPLMALVYLLLGFAVPRLPRAGDRRLVVAAVVLLAVAVILDFLEGLPTGHPMNLTVFLARWLDIGRWSFEHFQADAIDTIGHYQQVLEEFLEMFATTLLLAAFAGHLIDLVDGLRVRSVAPPD